MNLASKVELFCQGMESSQICILSSATSLPGGAGLGFLKFIALGYLGSEGLGIPKIQGNSTLKGICVTMQPEIIRLPKPKLWGSGHEKLAAVSVIIFIIMAVLSSMASGQEVLPRPERPLKAEVGRTFKDSKQGKIEQIKAPKGAPNIVIVLLDDVGFGAAGTFGGPVATPAAGLPRQTGTALQCLPHHGPLLAHPGRAAHRPQPPLGGDRGGHRRSHRL